MDDENAQVGWRDAADSSGLGEIHGPSPRKFLLGLAPQMHQRGEVETGRNPPGRKPLLPVNVDVSKALCAGPNVIAIVSMKIAMASNITPATISRWWILKPRTRTTLSPSSAQGERRSDI